jgi:myo-inositol-1(or 4)-monophosphatase
MNIEQEFADIKAIITKTSSLARAYFDADGREFELKADKSVVTEVDQAVETALLDYIAERFPNDAIVGEEHGERSGDSGYVWHIDPIDGTDNFLRKVPFCAISVARLGDTAEDSFGIVHNPITGQTFASLMEAGAYENERIANLTADTLGSGYLVTLGHGREPWMKPVAYELYKGVGNKFGRCKAYGSTALELAYVAANRIDAFLTYGLNTYDYAAGLFLVKAAGGTISVCTDGVWDVYTGSIKNLCDVHGKTIFVSHPDIHNEIRDFIGDPKQWADSNKVN